MEYNDRTFVALVLPVIYCSCFWSQTYAAKWTPAHLSNFVRPRCTPGRLGRLLDRAKGSNLGEIGNTTGNIVLRIGGKQRLFWNRVSAERIFIACRGKAILISRSGWLKAPLHTLSTMRWTDQCHPTASSSTSSSVETFLNSRTC